MFACRVSSFVRKGVELSAGNKLQNQSQVPLLCNDFRTTGGKSLHLISSKLPKEARSVQASACSVLTPLLPIYQINIKMNSTCFSLWDPRSFLPKSKSPLIT